MSSSRTARQCIVDALVDAPAPLSAKDLSGDCSLSERDVTDHLSHIMRSKSVRVTVIPAECRSCGFTFTKAGAGKPGKCPSCKNTWIEPPLFTAERT